MGTTFPARPEDASIFRTELEAGTRKSHGKTGKALPAHGLRLAGWGKLVAGGVRGKLKLKLASPIGKNLLQFETKSLFFSIGKGGRRWVLSCGKVRVFFQSACLVV